MLPSLLIHDIQQGLRDFLVTGFEPSDGFFQGLMARFVADEAGWMKGPYLQIGLPFRPGLRSRDFFDGFQTTYPSHTHQEAAWQRLSTRHAAANALVATGTGSGKTECFQYPLMDYAARAREAGESGIKGLVIYPMNALASDQAGRFANAIHAIPAFSKLRVGLFVGGVSDGAGSGQKMSPTGVITDRETLRKAPPDILLTNYKMLDYLLIRPRDRDLWAKNAPTTLRYVVVDELHTFDGAQGTDLALLLRRLKARLKTPADQLIQVGTSATLGGTTDSAPLRDYARQVFGAPFPPESVITEDRLSAAEFLGDAIIEHLFQARGDLAAVLDPVRYPDQAAAVAAWFALFFPGLPEPADVRAPAWRQALGGLLKRHLLFVNLLRLAKGEVVSLMELAARLTGTLPESTRPQAVEILVALLALVAWARGPGHPELPLVTLRLQVWLRELRRMVARVSPDPAEIQLRGAADLQSKPEGLHLPLVQCTQCHATGWLSRLPQHAAKVSSQLDEIYNAWFSGSADAVRLYPGVLDQRSQVEAVPAFLCGECGTLQGRDGDCPGCGGQALVRVLRTTGVRTTIQGTKPSNWHDDTCPACGERGRQLLLGARNATLGAQVVEHSWASPYNDDKKLIAFSDSVQDAAHRAGFFNARTYTRSIRTALVQALDALAVPGLAWSTFLDRFANLWRDPDSGLFMTPERFVSEFIGPNMIWQRDWAEELLKDKGLPQDSRLPARVQKRLAWAAHAEMSYLCRRGRTLERTGLATLSPDLARVQETVSVLIPVLHEQFGARGLESGTLFHWLWGLLTHLRWRGAVAHPELGRYQEDANHWGLMRTQGRGEWLPSLGERVRPVFLSLGQHRSFDTLTRTHGQTWYQVWLDATLGHQMLLAPGIAEPLYHAAILALTQAGLLQRATNPQGDTVGLDPAALFPQREVCFLIAGDGTRRLTVPTDLAETLLGMPCLDAPAQVYTRISEVVTGVTRKAGRGDLRRVIAAEHTGLLERDERERLERRFKSDRPQPWYENLLSATPTLEMGVDIGALSSVLLGSVPPNQASFLQRVGRAGRRDGNAVATTLADGASPHDLYFFAATQEMLSGEVLPPGVFLQAAEVLRRQLLAFCLDDWVASGIPAKALPDKTAAALDAVEAFDTGRFPYLFLNHLQAREDQLLPAFIGLLGEDMTPDMAERLRVFYQGDQEVDGLRQRILKVLEELKAERLDYKNKATRIRTKIRQLQAQPQDEATRAEIAQLDLERQSALALAREINQRDLLNTFTDAGLIPNYAFPEAGVELKSVLWRRAASDDATDRGYVALPALKYERPAASALSEFAPENRFYANQRRVEVDQINMNLAKLETWRLCPCCHHMENLEVVADGHAACPRCGDVMWSNVTQRRQLLRFRQAIANSDDTQVRIDDSADDREPRFYVRQLLADFEAADIREAWRLVADDLPFGFEFIARATFRDVNFGESGKAGDSFKVADKETSRPGFKLCRQCGKTQTPRRRDKTETGQQHAFDCEKRDSADPDNLVECLYLYREFHSEALRILVPYTRRGLDDEVVQSFIAALQLGLKKRFGGRVDHLRIVTQDEPGQDGGPRRQYVLLYDSVPGGTGYLHQLLSADAHTLVDILRLAFDALNICSCNADPAKDGCYRCLYQYRLGRQMEKVSRDQAKAVLGELLHAMDRLERVPTISEIYINPNFDSALEARFVESLHRLGGASGLPTTRLVQEIVNGKTGFLLEVGDQRYWLEPQVECGSAQGVAQSSKPDFVIWPAQARSSRRAIAVFCDGWAWHHQSLQGDARKRSALVAGGRFWVWSITHEDVKAALAGETQTDLESPLSRLNRHANQVPPLKADPGWFNQNAIAQLLRLLADPDEARLVRNAAVATFLMVHPPTDARGTTALAAEMHQFWKGLPGWMGDFAAQRTWAASRDGSHPRLRMSWPASLAKAAVGDDPCPGVWLFDETLDLEDKERHLHWRSWLAFYNGFQVLPGLLLTTQAGIAEGDYDDLAPVQARAADQATTDGQRQAWAKAIDQAMAVVQEGMRELAERAMPTPDGVGHEMQAQNGAVCAEAELVWLAPRLALLLDHQYEYAPAWEGLGWTVVRAEGEWVAAVIGHLGVSPNENREEGR